MFLALLYHIIPRIPLILLSFHQLKDKIPAIWSWDFVFSLTGDSSSPLCFQIMPIEVLVPSGSLLPLQVDEALGLVQLLHKVLGVDITVDEVEKQLLGGGEGVVEGVADPGHQAQMGLDGLV